MSRPFRIGATRHMMDSARNRPVMRAALHVKCESEIANANKYASRL